MCLGIPGQVLEVLGAETHMAAVLVSGARRTVNISLLEEDGVAAGDWVLVHAGLALSKLSEDEARETLAVLQELSEAFLGGPPEAAATATRDR